MKFRRSIIIASAVAMAFAGISCTKYIYVYSVGEANNAIVLKAGFHDDASSVQTKAEDPEPGAKHPHSEHLAITEGVKLRLRVDGQWYKTDDETATEISQSTVATVGGETVADSKHSNISMSPVLYWDDYGTADPHNIGTNYDPATVRGREKGLDIYGIGVNDKDVAALVVDGSAGKQWNAYSWTLPLNQSGEGEGAKPWSQSDLIISNNVKYDADPAKSNSYKFDSKGDGKLLEFTHAMSKIVFQVRPGGGFEGDFKSAPSISFVQSFKMSGNVDITTGTVTPTGDASNAIKLKYTAPANSDANHVHSFEGLMMPGNVVAETSLIKVTVDGNVYEVRPANLRTAMNDKDHDYALHSGRNYVVRIQIGKTAVSVTATIVAWDTVTAPEFSPSINVHADYGATQGEAPTTDMRFSFFMRKDEVAQGETAELYGKASETSPVYYTQNGLLSYTASPSSWSLKDDEKNLYWPDHNTHLHMRGVKPLVTAPTEPPVPAVAPVVYGDTFENQHIDIFNTAYVTDGFPSDLMIGSPVLATEDLCHSTLHTPILVKDHGICATTGKINLTFNYMMCQVEVRLVTSAEGAPDHVDLTNADVYILDSFNTGSVTLDGITVTPTGVRVAAGYKLDPLPEGSAARGTSPNVVPAANIRHSAIVPQPIEYTPAGGSGTKNVRIKVQVKGGAEHDQDQDAAVYYVENLPALMSGSTPATPNKKWEPGKHYIYTLDIRKTRIEVSATIVPWVEANAQTDVWM